MKGGFYTPRRQMAEMRSFKPYVLLGYLLSLDPFLKRALGPLCESCLFVWAKI